MRGWRQDLDNLEIHGFAPQALLFSSNNNYLTMDSSRDAAAFFAAKSLPPSTELHGSFGPQTMRASG
jgi:hypothetical protein